MYLQVLCSSMKKTPPTDLLEWPDNSRYCVKCSWYYDELPPESGQYCPNCATQGERNLTWTKFEVMAGRATSHNTTKTGFMSQCEELDE